MAEAVDGPVKLSWRLSALQVLEDVDLSGKTILVTGTTSGIGVETARALALKGAHLIMANRNILENEKLKQKIIEEKADAQVDLLTLDLSSLQSVQAAAREYIAKGWPLHVLVLNAGVFSPSQKATIDNLEMTWGVNHLAHFYLTKLLLPLLRQSAPSRIVIVSSSSHTHTGLKPADPVDAKLARLCPLPDASDIGYKLYAYSKLCNVLTAFKLHREENANGIDVYVLHPGAMIPTNISRSYGTLGRFFNMISKHFAKTLEQGASTTVLCAASPLSAGKSNKYWEDNGEAEKALSSVARDEALQDALWRHSDELIHKFENSRPPSS